MVSPLHVGVAALTVGGWLVLWGTLGLLGVELPYEVQASLALSFFFGTAWLMDKRPRTVKLKRPQTEEERLLARIRDDYGADLLDDEQMEAEIAAVLQGETPKRLRRLPPPKPSASPLTAAQMRRLAQARRGRPRPLRVDGYYGRRTSAQMRQAAALLAYNNGLRSDRYPGGGLDIRAGTITAQEITAEHIDPLKVSPFEHPPMDDCPF